MKEYKLEGLEPGDRLKTLKAHLRQILDRGSDPSVVVVRDIDGVDDFLDGLVETVEQKVAVFLVVAGQPGSGKTTIASGLLKIFQELLPEVEILESVYDEERRNWVGMKGDNWEKLSGKADLSAASFLLGNSAFRKVDHLIRSGKGVIDILQAPVITGKKVDLGYSAVKWIVETAAGRGNAEVFALVSIPTDELCQLSDEDRRNAWSMPLEEYARWAVERGIIEREDVSEGFLDERRQSMATAEIDEIVRNLVKGVVYNYQLRQEKTGKWDFLHYTSRQLDKNEIIRCCLSSLYLTDLFRNDLQIPAKHLLVFLKRLVPLGKDSLLDHIAKPADGVKKPFLKS